MHLILLIVVSVLIYLLIRSIMKRESFRFRTGYFCPDCSFLKSFSQCFECENCVWCPKCKKCVAGDAYGPYKKCCKYWKHRSDFHKVVGCRTMVKPFY